MNRLRIKNWAEFQHYKNRRPPWIKLHRTLLDDPDYHAMPAEAAKYLPLAWLIASEDDGYLPASEVLAFRLRVAIEKVEEFLTAWAPYLSQGASGVLAPRKQDAIPERETEREEETEKEKDSVTPPGATAPPPELSIEEKNRQHVAEWDAWCEIQRRNGEEAGGIVASYLDHLVRAVDGYYAQNGGSFTARRKAMLARQLDGVKLEPLMVAIEIYVDSYAGVRPEAYFRKIARNKGQLSERELDADITRHRAKMRGLGIWGEVEEATA